MIPTKLYRRAADLLGGMTAASRATGTHRRTIEDRLRGVFNVTPAAGREMAAACRERARELTETAAALERAADEPTP